MGTIELECKNNYPLIGYQIAEGNTIGHTGHGAFPQGNADWGPESDGSIMASHLHFEIIYIEDEDNGNEDENNEQKSSFPHLSPSFPQGRIFGI